MDTPAVMRARRKALKRGNRHWRRNPKVLDERGISMDQTTAPDFAALIPVSPEEFPVDARKLHAVLGTGREFNTWIVARIGSLGFEIGKDFRTFTQTGESSTGQAVRGYLLSLDMAKHLAMVERTDAGRRVRDYFIECERRLLAQPQTAALDPAHLPTHLETAEALVEALRANQKLQRKIEADAPKVEFHHKVSHAEGHLTVAEAAKSFGTGEVRLFSMLRGRGYLMRSNLPFQEYIDRGWFKVLTKTGTWGGREQVYRQTVITGKGLTALFAALRDLLPPEHTQPVLPGIAADGLLN